MKNFEEFGSVWAAVFFEELYMSSFCNYHIHEVRTLTAIRDLRSERYFISNFCERLVRHDREFIVRIDCFATIYNSSCIYLELLENTEFLEDLSLNQRQDLRVYVSRNATAFYVWCWEASE